MIITITGAAGSGKSTIVKMLSDHFGWPHYDMGELRRIAAKERGLTLAEYNHLGETDPNTDQDVDKLHEVLAREQANLIISGRVSWYFLPQSIKIYLDVAPEIGAKRIFDNHRQGEDRHFQTIAEVLQSNQNRLNSDNLRYQKYYQINVNNPKNYDLWLDTTNLDLQAVYQQIIDFIHIDKPWFYL